MADFIEMQDEDGNADNITQAQQAEPTEQVDNSEQVEQQPESNIPEKYRGKSIEDIIRMHQESEKLIGRQAQEVGESRRLLDEIIKQQLNPKKDTQQPDDSQDIEWFEDPKKAVNKAVENNPTLKELKEFQAQQVALQAAQTLQAKYPNFQEIVETSDFQDWVRGSRVRVELFAKANNYDVDSAIELLDTFTAIKGVKNKQAEEVLKKTDDEQREKALKSAAIQKGGSGESGKPIYRRADIIDLRRRDPDRYMAMQDEILLAYAEKRVK